MELEREVVSMNDYQEVCLERDHALAQRDECATNFELLKQQLIETQSHLNAVVGEACKCDPPLSGEEYCTGGCQLRALLAQARPHIGDEYHRSWPQDSKFDAMLEAIDRALI